MKSVTPAVIVSALALNPRMCSPISIGVLINSRSLAWACREKPPLLNGSSYHI